MEMECRVWTAVAVALGSLDQTFPSLPSGCRLRAERPGRGGWAKPSLFTLDSARSPGIPARVEGKLTFDHFGRQAAQLRCYDLGPFLQSGDMSLFCGIFMTAGGGLSSSPPMQCRLLLVCAAEVWGQNQFLTSVQVRSQRSEEDLERNPGEDGLFTGTEGTVPPLHPDVSEKWVVPSHRVELWTRPFRMRSNHIVGILLWNKKRIKARR